jgi:hypothetical protein
MRTPPTRHFPCPQSDSNRHWTDFKTGRRARDDQWKQVAEKGHIGCRTAYLGVASTVTVRRRFA